MVLSPCTNTPGRVVSSDPSIIYLAQNLINHETAELTKIDRGFHIRAITISTIAGQHGERNRQHTIDALIEKITTKAVSTIRKYSLSGIAL